MFDRTRVKFTNRWYTATGKRKRVPKDLEFFRDWAEENKEAIMKLPARPLPLIGKLGWKYGAPSILAAEQLFVYLIGEYNNGDHLQWFNTFNFDKGREHAERVKKLPAEEIRR